MIQTLSAPRPSQPRQSAFAEFGPRMLALPGVDSVIWSPRAPKTITVRFESPELAALGERILRPVVGDSHVVCRPMPGQHAITPGTPGWWNNPGDAIRAAAALEGVTRYGAGKTLTDLLTDSQMSVDHLAPMVRTHFGQTRIVFGVDPAVPQNGSPAAPAPAPTSVTTAPDGTRTLRSAVTAR